MDLMLIELVLWGGLLFFIWALKDGLGKVESDIESVGMLSRSGARAPKCRFQYYRPEQASEPIGSYLDNDIFRYVVIEGRRYEFNRIRPDGSDMAVDADERCVVPGLVYQECGPGG
jgi:hypothetical protein